MNQDPVKLNQVDWPSVVPGFHLLKACRFAYRLRTLLPAACAVLTMGLLLLVLSFQMSSIFSLDHKSALLAGDSTGIEQPFSFGNPQQVLLSASWQLLTPTKTSAAMLLVVCVLSQSIVLAFGIGISRAATSEFCVQQRSGPWTNLKLSVRNVPSALAATAAFIVFCTVAAIPVLAVRACLWFAGNDSVLLSAWPIIALFAIPVVLVWTLVMVSGPLAAAAIATDDCGAADAVSRAFCYVMSHKLAVWLLVMASTALAWFCCSVAEHLVALSISISAYGLPEDVTKLKSTIFGAIESKSASLTILVRVISTTVQFAVFQSAMAIGYVLLRKKEDAIPYREFSA